MSPTTAPTLTEFVEERREQSLPVHVAVAYDRGTYPSDYTDAAEAVAEMLVGDAGEVVDEPDALGIGDAIVLAVDERPRRDGPDWQRLRQLASVTRGESYAGIVAQMRWSEITSQVYHTVDLVVRVRQGVVEGIYQPRLDHPGGEWYLRRLESEVVDRC